MVRFIWHCQVVVDIFIDVTLQAYDFRGSWNPSDAGPHSSYTDSVGSITYWHGRGIPKNKRIAIFFDFADKKLALIFLAVVFGLPFYGKQFEGSVPNWDYKQIVSTYPSETSDPSVNKIGNIYFNGYDLIKQKSQYAVNKTLPPEKC